MAEQPSANMEQRLSDELQRIAQAAGERLKLRQRKLEADPARRCRLCLHLHKRE
jgi:hypothetical protein